MQVTIEYLMRNPDIITKLNEGKLCLLGCSNKQIEAIKSVFKYGWEATMSEVNGW